MLRSLVRAWPLPQFDRSTQLGGGLGSPQNATNFLAGALRTRSHQLSLFSSSDDDEENCPKFSFLRQKGHRLCSLEEVSLSKAGKIWSHVLHCSGTFSRKQKRCAGQSRGSCEGRVSHPTTQLAWAEPRQGLPFPESLTPQTTRAQAGSRRPDIGFCPAFPLKLGGPRGLALTQPHALEEEDRVVSSAPWPKWSREELWDPREWPDSLLCQRC